MEIKGDLDSLGAFGLLSPILAHQSAKFELSGQFCISRLPWGPWESQSSRMKPKSADPVTVKKSLSSQNLGRL